MRSSLPLQVAVALVALGIGFMTMEAGIFAESTPISVTGKVTLNGEPLKTGTIRFFSIGTDQPFCDVSLIRDGEYQIPGSETLVPAKYEVSVSGLGENATSEMAEPLPGRFNRQTVLRVEIKRRGSHHFDFNLKN